MTAVNFKNFRLHIQSCSQSRCWKMPTFAKSALACRFNTVKSHHSLILMR